MTTRNVKNLSMAIMVSVALAACGDGGGSSATNADSTNSDTISTLNEPMAPVDSSMAKNDDAELVSSLVESMYGGIALMKQGQEKASAKSVKDLAKTLVTAHTGLNNDLKTLASKKGWTIPTAESADDMKKREDMAKEDVTEYQKDWLEALKDRHETNIKKIENSKSTDPDLKAAAAKGLPKLHELLSKIEIVQKDIKKS